MNPGPQSRDEPAEEGLAVGAGIDFADPNAPLACFYLRASHVVAITILALVYLLLNHSPLWHTDFWGHLKFGEWIVQHGSIPDRDPFCPYADYPTPNLESSWLSQAVYYVVFHAGEILAGGEPLRQLAGGVDAVR